MCTLTILPTEHGYRALHSRDELRSRSDETPPSWHDLGDGTRACWPTDPDAGGTWVGVHENGFYLGLLNLNLPQDQLPKDFAPWRSRGLIIPELIRLGDIRSALDRIQSMDLDGFSPFRLVLVGTVQDGAYSSAIVRFDGVRLSVPQNLTRFDHPICLASSGLGDELVECRIPLFDEMVRSNPTFENQSAFHKHQWADRPEYSVLMSRSDARTSSITGVEVVGMDEPKIVYDPIPMGDPVCDPVGAGMLE